ncbi:MAG: hypothetical protein PVJ49_19555, partial [Acidobacteriota bacterium]
KVDVLGVGVGVAVNGAAAFAFGAAVGGSKATVTSTNLTEAAITGGSDVDAQAGSVMLTATDETELDVDVYGISVTANGAGGASGSIAIGFALADTSWSGTVRTQIVDSDVSASSEVILSALGDATIHTDGTGIAITVSVAAGFSLSGSGTAAVAKNTMAQTVEALILNADQADPGGPQAVTAGGKIEVKAKDDLHAYADALAISASVSGGIGASFSVSVAAAIAENTMSGVTRARVGNSRVDANGGYVLVKADSNSIVEATPDAYAVSGSIALASIAAAGSGAEATNTVTRTIEGVVDAGSNVTASTYVHVEAHDTSDAIASVTSVSLAVGVVGASIGIGLATNTMTATTKAHVSDSMVHAEGGEIRIDADATQDVEAKSSVVAITVAIAGVAGAGGKAVTHLDSTVEAYGHNANLTASGNVFVDADSTHDARAKTFGLAASLGFSVSVMVSEASVGGATRAYIDGASTVNTNDKLSITADSTAHALPDADSISISAAGFAGAIVDADVNRITEAYVGTRAGTTATAQTTLNLGSDDLYIKANSNLTADASPLGLSFGLLASGALTVADANVTGATLAYVGEKTTVNAGELDVIANSTENAMANNVAVALGGGLSVAAADATATIKSDTEAFTGVRAGETPTPGAVTDINLSDAGNGDGTAVIDADGTRTSSASASGGGLAFGFTGTVFLPTADTSGTVRAYVGEGTNLSADDLTITADGDTMTADAEVIAGSISGFASINVLEALAKVTGVVEAFIGAQVADASTTASPIITMTGDEGTDRDVIVDADSTMTATAHSYSLTGSFGLTISKIQPRAEVNGTTRAYVRDGVDLTSKTLKVEAGEDATDPVHYIANATTFLVDFSGLGGVNIIDAKATINGEVAAFIGAPVGKGVGAGTGQVDVGTAITIEAASDMDANADLNNASVSGVVSVGILTAQSDVAGITRAYVGQGADILATGLDVHADGDYDAAATVRAVQASGIATVAILEANATVSGTVDAHAGAGVGTTPSSTTGKVDVGNGDIDITAIGHMKAKPDILSVGVGGLATVSDIELNADVTGVVRAYVGEGMEIDAGSLDVLADAPEMFAEALGLSLSFAGLFAGSFMAANATVDGTVESFIGAGFGSNAHNVTTDVDVAGGDVTVVADAYMHAKAEIDGGGFGGLISVNFMTPTAIVSGRTSAFVRDGVNMVADSLKVQAGKVGGDRVKYEAEARSLTVNVSFGGAAQDLEAFALVGDPDAVDPGEGAVIEAFIGAPDKQTGGTGDPDAKLDINDMTDPVVVSALSDIDAIAKTEGGAGALGVTVAFYKPTADANGITRAYAGDGTDMRVT